MLELGGKSAAVILDDMDIETAARTLSSAECFLSGAVLPAFGTGITIALPDRASHP